MKSLQNPWDIWQLWIKLSMAQIKPNTSAVLQLLKWHIDFGADEAICEQPINRFETPTTQIENTSTKKIYELSTVKHTQVGSEPNRYFKDNPDMDSENLDSNKAINQARTLADKAQNLDDLREAIYKFDHCEFREDATNLVFSDGNPLARVMIIGEAPGRDEDLAGKPFVGKSGKLLDNMFGEINLQRTQTIPEKALYITNVVNWRPPGNRQPTESEIGAFRPFVLKHIKLIDPLILVLAGNPACFAILGKMGITGFHGKWHMHDTIPVMPTFHPAYLLRYQSIKQQAWPDLLMIKSKLRELLGGLK